MQTSGPDRPVQQQQRAIVVVFARLPVPGQVKTRLTAGIGPEPAADFYKLCAEHACLEVLRCPHADGCVFCASAADIQAVTDWLQAAGVGLPVQAQVQDPDLGRRMVNALTAAAAVVGATPGDKTVSDKRPGTAAHQYDAAIVIGTDIPGLSSEVLSAAVESLLGPQQSTAATAAAVGTAAAGTAGSIATAAHPGEEAQAQAAVVGSAQQQQQQDKCAPADLVLGPSADGGFYLMGFRTEALLLPSVQSCQVFEGVEWSCSSVLQRTAAAARALGLRVESAEKLPMLQDIDTAADAAAWLASREQQPLPPPQQQQQEQPQHQQQQVGMPAALGQPDDGVPGATNRQLTLQQEMAVLLKASIATV